MIKIILTSESSIKENAIKHWFKENKKTSVIIKKINIEDKLLPPQPINTGGMLSCTDRLKNVEDSNEDLLNYDYIISIENSLVVNDQKLTDIVNIKVKDILMGKEYFASGGEVDITYKMINNYSKITNIINDLQTNYEKTSKSYLFDGCEKTFGELFNKYYPNIQANNWMKVTNGIDRKKQIGSVLDLLSKDIAC